MIRASGRNSSGDLPPLPGITKIALLFHDLADSVGGLPGIRERMVERERPIRVEIPMGSLFLLFRSYSSSALVPFDKDPTKKLRG